jgi:hypothetical protein
MRGIISATSHCRRRHGNTRQRRPAGDYTVQHRRLRPGRRRLGDEDVQLVVAERFTRTSWPPRTSRTTRQESARAPTSTRPISRTIREAAGMRRFEFERATLPRCQNTALTEMHTRLIGIIEDDSEVVSAVTS